MKLKFKKFANALIPFDDECVEAIKKWSNDDFIIVEAKRPRNNGHHRKFFALLNIVLTNTDLFQSIDETMEYFKVKGGHYKIIKIGNTHYPITKSISFSSMSQDEFNQFYDKAIDTALEILPVEKDELATMIAQF